MQTKQCSKCGEEKSILRFHKDKKNRDGRCSQCAECKNAKKRVKSPFKEYNGKPIVNKEISIVNRMNKDMASFPHKSSLIVNIPITQESIFDQIYNKHKKFFTIQYGKQGMILTFHGMKEVHKGTAEEVIESVLN